VSVSLSVCFCVYICTCVSVSALKEMSASERHFTSIQELMKNAVHMKQQIHYYDALRRCQLSCAHFVPLPLISLHLPLCLSVYLECVHVMCHYLSETLASIGITLLIFIISGRNFASFTKDNHAQHLPNCQFISFIR